MARSLSQLAEIGTDCLILGFYGRSLKEEVCKVESINIFKYQTKKYIFLIIR